MKWHTGSPLILSLLLIGIASHAHAVTLRVTICNTTVPVSAQNIADLTQNINGNNKYCDDAFKIEPIDSATKARVEGLEGPNNTDDTLQIINAKITMLRDSTIEYTITFEGDFDAGPAGSGVPFVPRLKGKFTRGTSIWKCSIYMTSSIAQSPEETSLPDLPTTATIPPGFTCAGGNNGTFDAPSTSTYINMGNTVRTHKATIYFKAQFKNDTLQFYASSGSYVK